ncbi:sugar phosphate isomerase/epimerase family protein [Vibrio astriarenae]
MIYLSTGGFSDKTFVEVSNLIDRNIVKGLELSGGKYVDNIDVALLDVSKGLDLALHNYFPVPKIPFVFNLSSCNDEILCKSIEHAKQAIDLTHEIGGKYFSFHAGYLMDPQVDELGRNIEKKKLNDRDVGLEQFVTSVNSLASYAESKHVSLLIENNVISHDNYMSFGCDPLLMTEAKETREIFRKVNNNVGLLIDVAHLKVSANTLGFDPIDYLEEFANVTAAYHISDNNGLKDSNEPFSMKSWFTNYIRRDLDYYSLEIYTSDTEVLHQQYSLLSDILGK